MEAIHMNKNDFFFCYSLELSNFLRGKKIEFITIAQNPHTSKLFTLFPKSDRLNTAIQEYKQLNKQN